RVKNGQTGVVTGMDERGNVTVRTDGGKDVRFNCSDNPHQTGDAKYKYDKFDHAYASTIEKTQGSSIDRGAIIEPSNTNDLNTAVTRFREDAHLITASVERCKENCALPEGKTSTL